MTDPVPPADEPGVPSEPAVPSEHAVPEDGAGKESSTSAYLPVGIVFLSVAVVFFLNESMRAMAWAFFPLGITFLVLGARSRDDGGADAAEGPGSEPGAPDPDVTSR